MKVLLGCEGKEHKVILTVVGQEGNKAVRQSGNDRTLDPHGFPNDPAISYNLNNITQDA
jgi:hypothetical protein